MKTHHQSIGKEAPQFPENEDAWRVSESAGVWALADGAGGTGIFAGEWAQHLVTQIPDTPFADFRDLTAWLDGHWETFFDRYLPIAHRDYLIEQKFMNEGSAATLAILHTQQSGVYWAIYGDAVVVRYDAGTQQLEAANPDIGQFVTAPHLLNWLYAGPEDGFRQGSWPVQSGQQYALLSDTLGQYILMAYGALQGNRQALHELAGQPTALGNRARIHLTHWQRETGNFDRQVWQPLCQSLRSADAFLTHTYQLRAANLLGVDDYTCLIIDC